MINIPVDETFLQGAISARRSETALYPCRLPHQKKHLFPSPEDVLWSRAYCTSGVRIRMETDATKLTLHFEPLANPGVQGDGSQHCFDAVVNNEILQVVACSAGDSKARFDKAGTGSRILEIWLPPGIGVGLKMLSAEDGSHIRPSPDRRPMWVTWGSSLTHCTRAASAARTWPATVARKHNLNLMCLGFGGACLLEPMVAMTIRDLPADYISLKLGINSLGHLSERTYPPLVAAAVEIIREKHPFTPLALISPMASPPREKTPSCTGYTLEGMRKDMETVHRSFITAGDMRLYYINGLDFFGILDIDKSSNDALHPEADGIDLQAKRFSELVMPLLLGA
jgi:hypothetical protein